MLGDKRNMGPIANNCRLHTQQCWEEGRQQIELDFCMALVGLCLEYSILFRDPCFKGNVEKLQISS